MNRPRVAALLSSCLLLLAALPGSAAAPEEETGRIIVRFRDQRRMRAAALGASDVSTLEARSGVALTHLRRMYRGSQVLRLPSRMPLSQVEALLQKIRRDPGVEFAEPDRMRAPMTAAPNDTQWGSQWSFLDPATAIAGANLRSAWDLSTGNSSLVVAVIDTGWLNHADLSGRSVPGYCAITDPAVAANVNCPGADPSDVGDWVAAGYCGAGKPAKNSSWHGTHVAGTIAAKTNNGTGVAGVAGGWGATAGVNILPVRVLGKCGGWDSDIVDGMYWAANVSDPYRTMPSNPNPAKVLNLSLGGLGACPAEYQTAVNDITAAGAVVVVAAGNESASASAYTPASCSGVITVGATGRSGNMAWYSNYGGAVSLTGPGGDTPNDPGVLSTGDSGTAGPLNDSAYIYKEGTSMATPHVAGTAALMLSLNPAMTPAQVKATLQSSARPFPGGSTCTNALCGSGMLDANAAVRAAYIPSSAPGGLTPTTLGTSQIRWDWSAVARAASYHVYFGTNPTILAGNPAGTSFTLDFPPNTQSSVIVKAYNAAGEGPSAVSLDTATLALAPTGINSSAAHITSVTVNWTPCAVGACDGYLLQVSPNAGFTPPVYSSASYNRAVGQLQVSGLTKLTNYYLRLATLNKANAANFYDIPGFVTTLDEFVPPGPGSPVFAGVTSQALRFNWTANGNPTPSTYQVDCSSMSPTFSPLAGSLSGSELYTAQFSYLLPNTSYYFRVKAGTGGYYYPGAQATLAAAPAAAAASFTAAGVSSLSVAWGAANNPPDTYYQADLSLDAGFASAVSSVTRNLGATFTGLVSNALYYARVSALNRTAGASTPLVLGSTYTLVTSPGGPYSFTNVGSRGFTFSFSGNNPYPVTSYAVRVCPAPSCSPVAATAATNETSVSFSGLFSNQPYYVSVAALNQAGTPTPYTAGQPVTTLAVAPTALALPVAARSSSTLAWAWSPGTLSPGTTYQADLSSSPAYSWAVTSSATMNASALFTGLQPNTVYHGRVSARSAGLPPDPVLDLGALAATLSLPPPAAAFKSVFFTSATAVWQALPLAPSSASCQGYRLELSASPSFAGTVISSAVAAGASTATIEGIEYGTLYYARLAALNPDALPAYISLGSTKTAVPPLSSGTVSGAATFTLSSSFPQLTTVQLYVPPGAFDAGTSLSVAAQLSMDLSLARSNQVSAMTPLGSNAGIELLARSPAGDLVQPRPGSRLRLSLTYDPAQVTPGQDQKSMHLFTYDAAAGQWTMVPSQVDASAHVLTAFIPHFSVFAPFFVAAGSDLSAVQAFPQPWEAGDPSSPYWASALQITNLPAAATVRILTVTGELVAEGAAAGGAYAWNGENRFGRRAASGTYIVVVSAAGQNLVRRVVLIR